MEKDRQHYQGELERLKAEYQHEIQEKLQLLRDRIEREQFVYRLQFETEFKIYLALWERLIKVRNAALSLRPVLDSYPSGKSKDEVQAERFKQLADSYAEFQQYFSSNRPFFATDVYKAVMDLADVIHAEAISFQYTDPYEEHKKYWQDQRANSAAIQAHTETICDAIRRRIGIISQSKVIESSE